MVFDQPRFKAFSGKFELVLGDDKISFVVSLFQKQIFLFLFWGFGFFIAQFGLQIF